MRQAQQTDTHTHTYIHKAVLINPDSYNPTLRLEIWASQKHSTEEEEHNYPTLSQNCHRQNYVFKFVSEVYHPVKIIFAKKYIK